MPISENLLATILAANFAVETGFERNYPLSIQNVEYFLSRWVHVQRILKLSHP